MGVDQFACIPLSNLRKHYPSVKDVWLIFTVRDDADLAVVRNAVVEAERRRRRVPMNGENDFDVADPSFFTDLVFLLVGPMWTLRKLYQRLGLSY